MVDLDKQPSCGANLLSDLIDLQSVHASVQGVRADE